MNLKTEQNILKGIWKPGEVSISLGTELWSSGFLSARHDCDNAKWSRNSPRNLWLNTILLVNRGNYSCVIREEVEVEHPSCCVERENLLKAGQCVGWVQMGCSCWESQTPCPPSKEKWRPCCEHSVQSISDGMGAWVPMVGQLLNYEPGRSIKILEQRVLLLDELYVFQQMDAGPQTGASPTGVWPAAGHIFPCKQHLKTFTNSSAAPDKNRTEVNTTILETQTQDALMSSYC